MSPEEMRVRIAEACGYADFGYMQGLDGKEHLTATIYPGQEAFGVVSVPNYLNDLNAMHSAWQWLTSHDDRDYTKTGGFEIHLREVVAREYMKNRGGNTTMKEALQWPFLKSYTINATAAQRAEAFCLTLNLTTPRQ